MKKLSFAILAIGFASMAAQAATVYTAFPDNVNPKQKYVFYTHGKVLEGNTDRPSNPNKPQWGVYDFPAVKEKLSDDGYNLIAYHRAKDTQPDQYADKLKHDVNTLIAKGVPAKNITLVGFSRGGEITILAASKLQNKALNVAILAGCTHSIQDDAHNRLYGNVLSIYEASDEVGSCQTIVNHSPGIAHFKEIKISTGQQHGAFFRPNPEWVVPLKQWIASN